MAMKCCTKLETAKERCSIVFQGHPSNFKVTRYKTSPILTQIGRFRTIGRSQLSNPSDLPCFFSKNSRNSIFWQIFGHQWAEIDARNTEMNRGQESYPTRVNAKYQMDWAIIFFKKFRKPCLLKGRSMITLPPLVELGYNVLIGAHMWTLPQIVKIQNGTKCNTIRKSPSGSIMIGSMPLLIMRSPPT